MGKLSFKTFVKKGHWLFTDVLTNKENSYFFYKIWKTTSKKLSKKIK